MGVGRMAFFAEFFVSDFDGSAGGEHRVRQDQHLPFQARVRRILHLDVGVVSLVILPVSGDEGALRGVEDIEDAFVQGKACAEDRGDDDLAVIGRNAGDAQRRDHFLGAEFQRLADFVAENVAQPLQVVAETHPVFLDGPVTDLRDKGVEDRMDLSEVDDFHGFSDFNDFRKTKIEKITR